MSTHSEARRLAEEAQRIAAIAHEQAEEVLFQETFNGLPMRKEAVAQKLSVMGGELDRAARTVLELLEENERQKRALREIDDETLAALEKRIVGPIRIHLRNIRKVVKRIGEES